MRTKDTILSDPEIADVSLASDVIRAGLAYWMSRKGSGEMPSRTDIDPMDIPRLLPNVVMVDILSDPLDYMERVVGQTILANSSRNFTKIPWREIPGRGPDSSIWQTMDRVRSKRKIDISRIPYVGPNKDFLRIEVLSCPLSDDEGTVIKILCFVEFLLKNPNAKTRSVTPFSPL